MSKKELGFKDIKIKTVKASCGGITNTGNFENIKMDFEVEAEVLEGQDPHQVMKAATNYVQKCHEAHVQKIEEILAEDDED